MNIPVYLEPKLQKSVAEIARRTGQEMSAVVSDIVRKTFPRKEFTGWPREPQFRRRESHE